MKQTRNAITFLQAQYRALLQRTLWARFASVLSYGAAAGIGVPLLSSSIVIATEHLALDAAAMDAVAVIDPAAITYDFADGSYEGSYRDDVDNVGRNSGKGSKWSKASYTLAAVAALESRNGHERNIAYLERIQPAREFAYRDYGDYDVAAPELAAAELAMPSTAKHSRTSAYPAVTANDNTAAPAVAVTTTTVASNMRQADSSLRPHSLYHELWWSDVEGLSAFKADAVHESLLTVNHPLSSKQIDALNRAYQYHHYELSAGSLSAGASVPVVAMSAALPANSVGQKSASTSATIATTATIATPAITASTAIATDSLLAPAVSAVAVSSVPPAAQSVAKDAVRMVAKSASPVRVSEGRALPNAEQGVAVAKTEEAALSATAVPSSNDVAQASSVLEVAAPEHKAKQAILSLEHLGQQAIHIAAAPEHEVSPSVQLCPPLLGAFAAELATITALERSADLQGVFPSAPADQQSLVATRQQVVPVSTALGAERLAAAITMNPVADNLASSEALVVPKVPYAPVLMAALPESKTTVKAVRNASALDGAKASLGSQASPASPAATPVASVFAPVVMESPRYVARTNAQGQLQVKSADGTQLSFVPHNPSTQAVTVGLQEPAAVAEIAGTEGVEVERAEAPESVAFAMGEAREASASEPREHSTTSTAEPWLQISLAEGQSYDLLVETDEDWYALLNGLEGANGVEFASTSQELVFDLSGLDGAQPYTLKIDGSLLETAAPATALASNDSGIWNNAANTVSAADVANAASVANSTNTAQTSAAASSLHGGLLVSAPEAAMWRDLPELAIDGPNTPNTIASPLADSLQHGSNAVLDLQHVLYAPNFSGAAQGQMQMEVPLHLGEHTTLLLKDNLARLPAVKDSLPTAALGASLWQPYAAVKSDCASVFAPLYENAAEPALTVKLDVAPPPLSSATSRFDERVLSVKPHQGAGAVNVGGKGSDEIALTFYASPQATRVTASTANTSNTANTANTADYMDSRASTTPVRFIVGQDSEVELDMSALAHGSVAIAASTPQAQAQARSAATAVDSVAATSAHAAAAESAAAGGVAHAGHSDHVSHADHTERGSRVTDSAVVVQRDPHSHLLHIAGADLALAQATKWQEQGAALRGDVGGSAADALGYLHAAAPVQKVVLLSEGLTATASAASGALAEATESTASDLLDLDSLAAVRVDFAAVEPEHLKAVAQAVAAHAPVSSAGNASDASNVSNVANTGNAVNSGVLVPELSGVFHSQSLRLLQDYPWVEVPAQQTLALYSTPFTANVIGTDASKGEQGSLEQPVTPSFFLQTPTQGSAGVFLQEQSQLHLFGSGSIGPLTGSGNVWLQDAAVQVQSRQGTPADVSVKEISLERSRLQGRAVRATHFSLQDSALEAQALIVQGNNTAYTSTTERSAGALGIGSAVVGKESLKSGAEIDAELPRELRLPDAGKLPAVPAGGLPTGELEGEQAKPSGVGSEAGSALYSGAGWGSNASSLSGSLNEGSAGSVESAGSAGSAEGTGSFSALNSDVHVPYIDLRAATQAQMQGGSLQAQELRAHHFSLRDGVSAFVQHIELQGLDSVLSLGSVVAEDDSHKQGVQGSQSQAQTQSRDQSQSQNQAQVQAQAKVQSNASGRTASPAKSKAGAAKSSRASGGANAVKRAPLSLVMPEIPAFAVPELESSESRFEGQSNTNTQFNEPLKGEQALSDLTAAAEQLQQLKWQEQGVKHTSLVAQSVDLHGGLLQLYGAPHEQITVFTNSLQGRDDDGSSMRLSGNVIIGRNSALGLGNDYNAFAQAYNSYQQRYQQQQADLKSQVSGALKQRHAAATATVATSTAAAKASTAAKGEAGAYSTGAYLYVDRNNIKLGKHKLIMGTEDLSYLQSMLHSPYSIYLGSGSTMQISARALYGQDSNGAKAKDGTGTVASVDAKTGASRHLVFSDLKDRTVASAHGQLLVPVNTTSRDLSRIFGTGVNLRSGDVLHVSTENGLFTGKITNTEQLRGRRAFNLTMTGDPREALSELSAPTFEQSMRIIGTAVHSYDVSLFDSELGDAAANNAANAVNAANAANAVNVANAANTANSTNAANTMHDHEVVVGNLSDLSSVTANGVASVLQATTTTAAQAPNSTPNAIVVMNDPPVVLVNNINADIEANVNVVTVSGTGVNSALTASGTLSASNTLGSGAGASLSSGTSVDAGAVSGATGIINAAGAVSGTVISVSQDAVVADTSLGNDIVAGGEVSSSGASSGASAGVGANVGSGSVSGAGSGASSGSGASAGSGAGSGVIANNPTQTQQPSSQIKFNKQSAGYAFLMDALGANNSESIEKVTRMAILGGALHGVYLVNNTANDAMHSRLGVGVSAALAVNSEREGNITISDNHQGSALWMTPMYRSYNANDLSAQGREYGTDLEVFGVVMGLDFTPMEKWRTGLMWNIGDGQAEGKDVAKGINNDFNFYGLGLYTSMQLNEKFSLSADVGYVKVKNKLAVDPQLLNWGTMESDVSSESWSVNIGAQYRYRDRNFEMIPHVGLHYTRLDLDTYDVTSDGKRIASSDSDIMHMWSVPLGVTFACDMAFDTWVLRPALDLTVVTNLGDTSMDSKTAFDGIEGADFEYTTDIFDRFSYGATIGVSASSQQISFGINVGYTGSAHTSDIMGSAQLRYIF